ncbi:hypothetical protein ACVWZ6_004305 [Bradyrhizobium sp. GM6.1]
MAGSKTERDVFGTLPDGRKVDRIVLRGEGGFEARIITHGAVLQALIAPDGKGGHDDVVLGHDGFAGYLAERKFFGATVGRYANRIANGQFSLDGETVQLPVNNGPNALHGGLDGFDRKLWDIAEVDDGAEPAVTLTYTSSHGEENYPGRLDVRLTYRVTGPAELSLIMEARTDRPTIVNLTKPQLLQSGGRDIRHAHSRSQADGRGRAFPRDRPHGHSVAGAAAQRCRHAVRFPGASADRRAHPRERPAIAQRQGLRPYLLSRARR